ncbi:hypothetical protein ACFVYG_19235 [Streptomyces sp. NPDC058256]|uniref:hypothetical protein n=1 Tax=Streptomyces sp. NPDC058256 TaxID=3346408 RepID=UPI0036EED6AF
MIGTVRRGGDLDGVAPAVVLHADRAELPFWPLLFSNVTLRLLGSDDFPSTTEGQAAGHLTATGCRAPSAPDQRIAGHP